MSDTRLTVPTVELRIAQDKVRAVLNLMSKPEPLLKAWGLRTMKEIDDIFRAHGIPAWKPLAPSTQAAHPGRAPLAGIKNSMDLQVQGKRAVIFSRHPAAGFMEFGTKGPYEIRPRVAKALAFPFFPGGPTPTARKRGVGGVARGRSRGNPRQKAAYALGGGKQPLSFFAHVTHPGLPVRRIFPTPDQLGPKLEATTEAVLKRLLERRSITVTG